MRSPKPGFDTARIEEFRRAIREGRFRVDTGMVADRLMAGRHQALRKSH